MKPTTWMFVGAVILIMLAAAGICLGGFMLLGAAGGAEGVTGLGIGGVVFGLIALIGGVIMIIVAARKQKASQEVVQNVTYTVDLPGQTKIEQVKCQSCGGTLTADNIQMVNGAPMVNCPFCHTAYQLTEEPKW